jgi:hypothetical protein
MINIIGEDSQLKYNFIDLVPSLNNFPVLMHQSQYLELKVQAKSLSLMQFFILSSQCLILKKIEKDVQVGFGFRILETTI